MPTSELQTTDDLLAKLRGLLLQLNGHGDRPGVIQLLDGSEHSQGLIAQTYHTGELLKELLERRESAADLFEPGELQDQKIDRIRQRLGAALSEESRRVTQPVVESIQAASQEVLMSLKQTRDEHGVIVEQLEDVGDTYRSQMEALHFRFEELIEKIFTACEHLDKISSIDTVALNAEVKAATEAAFKDATLQFREADKAWLQELLGGADEKLVQRLRNAIEGQNVIFEEQFLRARSDLAKAIEGKTYGEVLNRLNKTLADREHQVRDLTSKLHAAEQAAAPRASSPVLSPIWLVGSVAIAGLLSSGVTVMALLNLGWLNGLM